MDRTHPPRARRASGRSVRGSRVRASLPRHDRGRDSSSPPGRSGPIDLDREPLDLDIAGADLTPLREHLAPLLPGPLADLWLPAGGRVGEERLGAEGIPVRVEPGEDGIPHASASANPPETPG